jgi:hypothetical protein
VIARAAAGQPAVLIGHSGSGPLLALAGALAGQARGYVVTDAGLPIPGQSRLETVPAGLATQVRTMADWFPLVLFGLLTCATWATTGWPRCSAACC